MLLAEVLGRVWSERQLPALAGRRFVLVRELGSGVHTVAVDLIDVGIGSTVLVTTDEAAATACGEPTLDAAVVALVSGVDHDPRDGRSETPMVVPGRGES
jgi:ethanolamine utilization protein EutN